MEAIAPPDDRLERRREIRLRIAEIGREMLRLREDLAKIASCKQKKIIADAQHSSACQPLIAERDEIEARQNSRAADRQPPDAAAESRLLEIAVALESENDKLHLGIAAIDVELKQLLRGSVRKETLLGQLSAEKQILEGSLVGDALGRPDLFARAAGLKHVLAWLRFCLNAARSGQLADGCAATLHTRDARRIALASDEAERILNLVQAQFDSAISQMKNE
jgi:hypothetical protein